MEIDDSRFENSVFVIHNNSIDFDMTIGTDVLQQCILTISRNNVKIYKCQNNSKNSWVNVINASKLILNSKCNPYTSTFQNRNSRVPNEIKFCHLTNLTFAAQK